MSDTKTSIPWQYEWKRPQLNPIVHPSYTSNSQYDINQDRQRGHHDDDDVQDDENDEKFLDDSTSSSLLLSASSSFIQPTSKATTKSASSLLMKNGIVTCHVSAAVSWEEIQNFVNDDRTNNKKHGVTSGYNITSKNIIQQQDPEVEKDDGIKTGHQRKPKTHSTTTPTSTWHLSATLVRSCTNSDFSSIKIQKNQERHGNIINNEHDSNSSNTNGKIADVLLLEIIETYPTTSTETNTTGITTSKSLYSSFQLTSSTTISPPKNRKEIENFSKLLTTSTSVQDQKEEADEKETYSLPDPVLTSTCLQSRILHWPGICIDDNFYYANTNNSSDNNNPIQSWWNGLTNSSRRSPKQQQQQQNTIDSNRTTTSQRPTSNNKFALSVGITAVTWIRKPVIRVTNVDNKTTKSLSSSQLHHTTFDSADALDVIQLMSLFGGQNNNINTSLTQNNSTDLPLQNIIHTEDSEQQQQHSKSLQSIFELQLVCLTSDGQVHIYSPWNLLKRNESTPTTNVGTDDTNNVQQSTTSAKNDVNDMTSELASFFLGESLINVIDNNMLPLSQPQYSIKLSVPFLELSDRFIKKNHSNYKNKLLDPPLFTKQNKHRRNVSSIPEDYPSHDNDTWKEEKKINSIWDESVWNPIIDTQTIHNQTRSNIPTHCISAFDFIVIAGRGVQRWKRNRNSNDNNNNKRQQQKIRHRSPSLTAIDKPNETKTATKPLTTMIDNHPNLVERSTSDPSNTSQSNLQQQEQHTSDNRLNSKDTHQEEYIALSTLFDGGFLTFISTKHFSETRTIFLPFIPEHISPFHWCGASFLFVSGRTSINNKQQPKAIAIRLDSSTIFTPQIHESAASVFNNTNQSLLNNSQRKNGSTNYNTIRQNNQSLAMIINRFEIIPIDVPEFVDGLQVSKVFCSPALAVPPSLAILLHDEKTGNISIGQQVMLTIQAKSREDVTSTFKQYEYNSTKSHILIVNTHISPGHFARDVIPCVSSNTAKTDSSVWCQPGQGFCIAGTTRKISFICFEGSSTNRSPYVQVLYNSGHEQQYRGIVSTILGQNPYENHEMYSTNFGSNVYQEPYTSRVLLFPFVDSNRIDIPIDEQSESLIPSVLNAMESISSITYRETVAGQSHASSPRRRSMSFTPREKSIRLLQNSPWWSTENKSDATAIKFNTQIPTMSIALHNSCHTLSVRKIMADNKPYAHFDQIITWLCEMEDYCSAVCLALDLLQDSETLFHLWRNFKDANVEDEKSKHEGLLDGIQPIKRNNTTLRELSNITITCLVKGGYPMSGTLEEFISRNAHYDEASVCLILVAVATGTLSDDNEFVMSSMGKYYSPTETHSLNIMWPVRCLLRVGNSRGILSTTLRLLNSAIPDELRRHQRSGMLSTSVPSIDTCKQLVTLIVACNPDAAGMLLDLVNEKDNFRYWQSLDHDTRLELSLIAVDDQYPLLREVEIRNWAMTILGRSIEFTESLPTEWIRSIVWATLKNAGCDISTLCTDLDVKDTKMTIEDVKRQTEVDAIRRRAMQPKQGSGGLDFDLLIPSLLLLEKRCEPWHEPSNTCTRTVLNTASYLAGRRRTSEEAMFPLDGATLMRLCTVLGDVEAGAKLIGGKNGLILECCHVLIESLDISMDDAEEMLLSNPMVSSGTTIHPHKIDTEPFALNASNRKILYLFEEHVLRIRTYGEFDVQQLRGKVDPVFAARICFRTWWYSTQQQCTIVSAATQWLVEWLRIHLLITTDTADTSDTTTTNSDKVSPHRLAAAALLRALIWSDADTDESSSSSDHQNRSEMMLLASIMKMNIQFIIELSQSCCGLIEALPSSVIIEESLQSLQSLTMTTLDSSTGSNKRIERAY